MADIDRAFKQFTTCSKIKDGYRVKCKKGLWAIEGTNKEILLREGRRYFMHYFKDGEYRE